MKTYEYTTSYLFKDEAKDVNNVIVMMNAMGADGWHFTGYANKVKNGTFYYFARVKATV